MRMHLPSRWPLVLAVLALVALILLPSALGSPYLLAVAITALMYVALALGYDLIVGRMGLLSLAVAAFFGIGAYTGALIGIHTGSGFLVRVLAGIAIATLAALAIGVPSFRLSYHSFAIGTLGFALIAQVIALNWIEVTRGPLCLVGVPPADLRLGSWSWAAQGLRDYYYIVLALAVVTFLIVWQIERTRVGRTFLAIRDDERLAAAVGTPVLKYKLLAFAVGAGIAGAIGVFYASYASVVCPSELAFTYTVNLIVILFLGGRGTLIGPILAAVLFTVLPELLRATQAWRLVIYGLLIIVGAIYMPEGIVTTTIAWLRQRAPWPRGAPHD
jgi:ABC-type branched-subunit amino acid transport system permease subunit